MITATNGREFARSAILEASAFDRRLSTASEALREIECPRRGAFPYFYDSRTAAARARARARRFAAKGAAPRA